MERAQARRESARMGKSILVNENDIYRHIDAIIIFYAVGKETIERRIDNDIGISLSTFFFVFVAVAVVCCAQFTFNFLLSRSIIGLWFHCYCYLFVVTHTGTHAHNGDGIRVQQIYRSEFVCIRQ